MQYRYLGSTGLVVSELSLGTMTFGAAGWGCSQSEAHQIISAYIDAGGNMIDTADVYAGGETERIIGSCMESLNRCDVMLASKCNFPVGGSPNSLGSNRKHMVQSCEQSLRRLKTDYLDFYYLHRTDPSVPPDEIMETFDILIRQGKVLYPACSNLPAWRIVLDNAAAVRRGYTSFACGQYMYNLIDRFCEQEIIPAMMHQGMGFLAWSPLAGGLLTGKYDTTLDIPQDSRFDHRRKLDGPRFWTPHGRAIVRSLSALARECGRTESALALGWLSSRPQVASIIIGSRSVQQLQQNIKDFEQPLSEDLIHALDVLSEPERCYLWQFDEKSCHQFLERGKAFPFAPGR